ncbi:MAG: T9SS type A sorting domain-containing protein [Bacteroidia bacterium]
MNAAGCDSVVTLNLTIGSESSIDVQSACASYTWTNGVTYTSNNNTATDTFTNIGGCDSIVTLNFTILSTTYTDVVTACDTFTWMDGVLYTASNNTATYTLTNAAGCDSVITLDLTILNSSNPTLEVATACGSYTWNGKTYTSSNFIDEAHLTNVDGCDSTVRLNLTILPVSRTTDVISACNSYYTWIDGNTYTASNNTATYTYTNAAGCDSIVTLDLTITSPPSTDVVVSCNSYYTWTNGVTYTSDNNTATDTFMNAAGCDSVVTLDLTISSLSSIDTRIACDTFTWTNGVLYYASNNTATDTFMNAAGCDSVVTLNLTMNYTSFGVDVITACNSYTWTNGVTYTTTNFFARDTITSSTGCDSIVRLNLTINNSDATTDVVFACGSYYTWVDGNTYNADNNTATYTYTNVSGCDSVVTLDLTIGSPATTDVITACDSYTWIDGITYTSSNNSAVDTVLNAANCDSIVFLDLTINSSSSSTDVQSACDSYTWIDGNTYTENNNTATYTYTNAVGCDSIVTLDLTILSNSSTFTVASCDMYTWVDGNTYTASNNTATYTYTNAAGCDSIVSLDLTINNTKSSTDIITACDSYTWTNGVTYTANNNTAKDTFATSAGCDSIVTLDLTVNYSTAGIDQQTACTSYTWIDGNTYTASNNTATHILTNAAGCDSTVSLDLTILAASSSTDVVDVCDSYKWIDGKTYTESNNTATVTLTNSVGCDSIVSLDLTIREKTTGTDIITACDSYVWIDGRTYTKSNNTSTHTLTNAAGCDSIVSLDLTMNYSTSGTETVTTCDSYTWIDGNTYTASNNTATHTLTNAAGCDSIVTLDLTINYSKSSTDVITACNNYTWVDGEIYTTSNNTATYTYTTASGCDSVVTLDLTIQYGNRTKQVVEACGSFTWIDGNTYTEDTRTPQFTLPNVNGCDSIVTLNLTVLEASSSVDVINECISYTWIDGITYTESNNTATFTLTNAAGCDSVITLNLTIRPVDVTITNGDPQLETKLVNGAKYQWLDCTNDYATLEGETGHIFRASDNNSYAVEISAAGCTDTSDCITVARASVTEDLFNEVNVYPNPTNGKVKIDLGSLTSVSLKLYDLSGKVIYEVASVPSNTYEFDLKAAAGVYILEVNSNDKLMRTRIIKR